LAVLERPLAVTYDGNVPARQTPSEILERFIGADGLVLIVGAGAVHQHDGGEWSRAVGKGQGARELPGSAADRDLLFMKAGGLGVVRGRPRCVRLHRHDEKSSDPAFRIKDPLNIERRLFK